MKVFALFSILYFLFISSADAQGCSDAGFCTMGAMKPDQHFSKKINLKLRTMELSFYRGTTTMSPIIYSTTLDLNFSLNSRNTFQVKLPYQWVEGTLANTKGIGDISLCFTRNLLSKEEISLNFSLGGKIKTNDSDKTTFDSKLNRDLPLPMYYQTSLGTYDAIAGLSLISRKWLLATGIQIPFNENKNKFVWGAWTGSNEDQLYIEQYSRANQLQRGIDVMLRVERNFRFSRLNFSVGLLPIYRINRDEVSLRIPPATEFTRVKPEGTTGMALSGIITAGYSFNTRTGVKVLLGRKITQRDENPDGLTRIFVSSFTYFYRF
jgi:hypothetical protein